MVQITGSKFYMGPPFAGALLVPPEIARRAADMAPLPASLGAYFGRLEWPPAWGRLTAGLSPKPNIGLLLRWQAALAEMEAFNRVPDRPRIEIMTALAETLHAGIAASDATGLIAAQATAPDWPPTIFAVQIVRRDPQGTVKVLDMVALKEMHALLNQDLSARLPTDTGVAEREIAAVPCHIGQPVKIGAEGAAVRICIGARQGRRGSCGERSRRHPGGAAGLPGRTFAACPAQDRTGRWRPGSASERKRRTPAPSGRLDSDNFG